MTSEVDSAGTRPFLHINYRLVLANANANANARHIHQTRIFEPQFDKAQHSDNFFFKFMRRDGEGGLARCCSASVYIFDISRIFP